MGDSIHSIPSHPRSRSAASTSGHSRELRRFVAHDSAFAHHLAARLELWFHQHHNLARSVSHNAAVARITAGSTSVAEMNDTSMAMKSTRSPMSPCSR